MIEKAKSKRKPKNFFRYFLDEFILFRRDFYFAIEREPEEMIDALTRLWRRDDKYYHIDVDSLEADKIWQLQVSDRNFSTTAKAKLYQEKNLTIIEGTVYLENSGSGIVISGLLFLMLILSAVSLLIQRNLTIGGLFFLAPIFLLALAMRLFVIKDHQRLVAFMERFMTKEENRLDAEWEKQYKKEKRQGFEHD